MYAFEDNVTILDEDHMNALLSLQDFTLIYEGTQFDGATAAGTTQNSLASYYYASQVNTTGSTTFSRVELELVRHGSGEDLTLYLLDTDFNPDGSAEGTILKTITVPKEFFSTAVGTYLSMALNVSGLSTAAATYYLKTAKVGDATNYLSIVGLATDDSTCYHRSGTSGAWTANNTLHFKAFSGVSGDMVHSLYGSNMVKTFVYSGEDLTTVYRYMPSSASATAGIRDVLTLTYDGDYLTGGA
jgi:hypothetical protein